MVKLLSIHVLAVHIACESERREIEPKFNETKKRNKFHNDMTERTKKNEQNGER